MIDTSFEVAEMSEHEVRLFEAKYAIWKSEHAEGLPASKAFERFVAEQVLKDFDLDNDEVISGELGGGDDGGVDSAYLFMGSKLITTETPPIIPAGPIQLHIIQAKEEKTFKETPVTKLEAFAKDLLTYSKPVDTMTYLNSKAQDAITNFREKYSDEVMGHPHTLAVHFHYACKADALPGPKDKINVRGDNLKAYVKAILSSADVTFTLWNAQRLHDAAKTAMETTVVLPVLENFSTEDGSTVCLVKLTDYADRLLIKENGEMQTRFLEPNVRDYQGTKNPVNTQIRATLSFPISQEEFWWLNNGVTIIADECPVNGHKAKIKNPEIVNGLQTSHEVYQWRKNQNSGTDNRAILIKIIVANEEKTRSRIIKSTNSQTKVDDFTLLANDPIQESIEDRLRLYGLFYDRKKGEYKRLKKPINSLVGMGALAQAFIAIVLQQPDQARGRPQTYIKKNKDVVYDEKLDLDFYAASILIDRQVESYLEGRKQKGELTSNLVRDLHYYVAMLLGKKWNLATKSAQSIADAMKEVVKPIPENDLWNATEKVMKIYLALGGTDKNAKSTEMRDAVQAV
jgi:hypothetical protein